MKEAENTWELVNVTDMIECFYDEQYKGCVIRCSLYLKSRPTLGDVTRFEAQKIINSTGNGMLGTGLYLNQSTTSLLTEGRNATWYHHKSGPKAEKRPLDQPSPNHEHFRTSMDIYCFL